MYESIPIPHQDLPCFRLNMNHPSPASSSGGYPSKRARLSDSASPAFPSGHSPPNEPTSAPVTQSSSFRNVSACNRCRLRKNRCDQKLPSCASCEKANIKCVGYDPITKREIPRSYVFYLETRVAYLESLLQNNHIPYAAAEVLNHGPQHAADTQAVTSPADEHGFNSNPRTAMIAQQPPSQREEQWQRNQEESGRANHFVESLSASNASDPRHLGSTSGISFARVVFAAVKSSVSGSISEKGGVKPSNPGSVCTKSATGTSGSNTSMRDSFFGLHPKPTIKPAPFPDRELGLKLVDLYFEHANPQIPILHRPTFMEMFENAYRDQDHPRTPREEYILNIVFATGAGIVYGDTDSKEGDRASPATAQSPTSTRGGNYQQKCQPEEYHASAIVHLESCLSHSSNAVGQDGFGGGLLELQAVLLLAGFALLRPVAPGLWYIVGVAVRLGVDLGLHYEDGKDIDVGLASTSIADHVKEEYEDRNNSARERGRRQWIRDLRRRLWWCVYSFDRLVSTCVGRPFGITDQVITTGFPSLLDDKYITPGGFLQPSARPDGSIEPSYKYAAHHYFRLRLLQSEILQVLQHQQAKQVRASGVNKSNPFIHKDLPSPYLVNFNSFRDWRIDIDRRLWHWKGSAPTKAQTGVGFSVEFLELNYWQAVIMLYRQSLCIPPMLETEVTLAGDDVESPGMRRVEEREDEERVYLKVAEAGQKVLRLYRQLHRVHLVNYTFLATHHLFMAGISFLYAIWHSPIVRSRLTMDEVDFTILAATSVLGDLIEKCPPAEACRDAFDRMSKATVQMCLSSTGFSSSAHGGLHSRDPQGRTEDYFRHRNSNNYSQQLQRSQTSRNAGASASGRPAPNFDMALNDLYSSPTSTAPPIQSPQYRTALLNNTNGSGRPRRMEGQMPYPQVSQSPNYTIPSPDMNRDMNSAIDSSLLPPQISQQRDSEQRQGPPSYILLQSSSTPTGYGEQFSNGAGGAGDDNGTWSNMNLDFLGGGTPKDGIDLGFGLGYESLDHDFSNGNQHDLFEGFFFGGAGNF